MSASDTTEIRLIATVKAYPAVSTRHGEVVCIAGIRTDSEAPEWVRLWPIDFRGLESSDKFRKYEEITLRAKRSPKDRRPESWSPELESIARTNRFLSADHNWHTRKALVEPLMAESMCEIVRRQELDGTSLGVFRPAEVLDLIAVPNVGEWDDKQKGLLGQLSFLTKDRQPLQKIPYDFKYRYRCSDAGCKTHTQGIVDWELMQAYRGWGGSEEEKLRKVKAKWLDQVCGVDRDTAFFVGNQHQSLRGFLVLGVFWPRVESQLRLQLD
jgi:hypothetical protein